jgi:hypothetical protein
MPLLERNAFVSTCGDTSKSGRYGPTLAPIALVATSSSKGKISSSFARTSWKPCGSISTSAACSLNVAGGGGGGLTSNLSLTTGSFQVTCESMWSNDSSDVASSAQVLSSRLKKHEIMMRSSPMAAAKWELEHMSLRSARSGPENALASTALNSSAIVGSTTAKLSPTASLNAASASEALW